MKPIGQLMIEHRLIERMIALVRQELGLHRRERRADAVFIGAAVDFFWSYADRTHHGKEEDILFRALAEKPLPDELKAILERLKQEHTFGRQTVTNLSIASGRYVRSDPAALVDIITSMEELVRFYPAHIELEDKHFFFPTQEYFTRQELDDMLREFNEFDRRMIHEKYQGNIAALEKARSQLPDVSPATGA